MPNYWLKPLEFFNDLYPMVNTTINQRKYNRLLDKLTSEDTPIKVFCGDMFKINSDELIIFHITDEQLGKNIYNSLISGKELPDDFDLLKFVSIKKEERVVFAVYYNLFPKTRDLQALKSYLKQFGSLVDSFIEFTSTDENKTYIDYTELFSSSNLKDDPISISLMRAITTNEPSEQISHVIDVLLDFSRVHWWDSTLTINYLQNAQSSYTQYLRHGISIAQNINFSLPTGLYVNIVKYAIDPTYFNTCRELFDFNSNFEDVDVYYDTFIFDSDRFSRNLKFDKDCNEFVSYTLGTLNFLKLKDNSRRDFLTNLICDSKSKDVTSPLSKFKIVTCSNDDTYLYVNADQERIYSLHQWLKEAYIPDHSYLINFLNVFINVFKEISENVNLSFNKDIDYLSCIWTNSHGTSFYFKDLSDFCFENNSQVSSFDIDKAALQIVNSFLINSKANINIGFDKAISNYPFLRLFPKAFVEKLCNFNLNGTYERSTETLITKGVLNENYLSRIVFVEEIKKDNYSSQYSFIKDVDISSLNSGLANFLIEAKAKQDPNCIALDDKLAELNLSTLNPECLEKLRLSGIDLYNLLLMVDSIVISHTLSSGDEYKIVGVKWNFDSLVSITYALGNKLINTKQFYMFLTSLVEVLDTFDIQSKINLNEFYISLSSYKAVVLNENLLKQTTSAGKNLIKYYTSLLNKFKNENLLDGYDILDFDEVYNYNLHFSTAHNLTQCRWHPGHWKHKKSEYCPVCKKIYHFCQSDVSATFRHQTLFSNKNFSFLLYDGETLCFGDNKYYDSVEKGITNNLYADFVGLKPEKLAVVKENYGRRLKTVAIKFVNGFDFGSNIKFLTDFEHIQRLKAVLSLYSSLLPKITSKKFIATDKQIFDSLLMHTSYKGEIVIPNILMLDCETILSNDDDLKTSRQNETLKMFSEFLLDYISSDKYLSSDDKYAWELNDIIEDIKKCSFNPLLIKHYLTHFSKLCKVHKVYFGEGSICHKCLNDGITEKDVVTESPRYFSNLEKKSAPFDGGEANIYPYNDTQVQKLFKEDVDVKFKSKILGKSLEKKAQIQKFNEEHEDIEIICADKLLYESDGKTIALKGFTQAFVNDAIKISSLKDKAFVAKELGYTRKDIVDILMKVCVGIEFIHSIGGYIGDLNGGNVLIKDKKVYFIDIDGMSFDDVKNSVYTPSYIYPPSAENNNITADDDWYSIAIQCFYYLTYSHPFRGVSKSVLVSDDEVTRMKEGHSLLGKYDIEPPSVSIGWDFLPKYMINFFLNTFEKGRRESMLSVLTEYYNELIKSEPKFSKVSHKHSVSTHISENTYIDSRNNFIHKENILIRLTGSYNTYWNDNFVFISKAQTSYLLDETTGEFVEFQIEEQVVPIELYKNLVFVRLNDGNVKVYQNNNGTTVDYLLPECAHTNPLCFSVQNEGKFIFLYKDTAYGSYVIKGNKLNTVHIISSDMLPNGEIVNTDILYDKETRKWLVTLSSNTETLIAIVSSKTGSCTVRKLPSVVNSKMYFYKNTLYYVDDNQICSYNVINYRLNFIPCDVVNPDSLIKRENNVFVINNHDNVYLYEKS